MVVVGVLHPSRKMMAALPLMAIQPYSGMAVYGAGGAFFLGSLHPAEDSRSPRPTVLSKTLPCVQVDTAPFKSRLHESLYLREGRPRDLAPSASSPYSKTDTYTDLSGCGCRLCGVHVRATSVDTGPGGRKWTAVLPAIALRCWEPSLARGCPGYAEGSGGESC